MGCQISDVDVIINWAKTAGTCSAPTGGYSYHRETSFRIDGPLGNQVLAQDDTWSGGVTTTNVITTFSQGPAIPSGTPSTGTYGPNNGNLNAYIGGSPVGNWNLRAGDDGFLDPLCIDWYQVRISVATDATPPSFTSTQSNINIAANASCQAVATWSTPTATDPCGVTVTRTAGPPSGTTFNLGTTSITYTASDNFGNSSTQTFSVTVYDNSPPVFTPCPGNITLTAPSNSCVATATFSTPTATDNCSVSVTQFAGPGSGSPFPVGTTNVTFRATDGTNNTDCTFSVIVSDNEDPVISCPTGPFAISANASCVGIVSYSVSATDNCSASITSSPSGLGLSGDNFSVGTHNLTFTAADPSGNTDACSFTVVVTDDTPPVITCPGNINVSNDVGDCFAVVTFSDATATDNCGVGSPTQSAGSNSGSNFPIGTSTVSYSVTDVNGNSSSCSFTVTVNDTENPTISFPADIVVSNDAGFCTAIVNYTVTSSDNCPSSNLVRTVGEASGYSFPVNGGNAHTITHVVTDASGNTATCSFTVTVNDDENPVINCPANITVDNDPNQCDAVVTWTEPIGTDNCPGVTTVRTGPAPGSVFNVLTTTTISYLTTDVQNGLTATCSFTVTVEDNDVPLVTCPADQNVTFPNCEYLLPDYLALQLVDTADNCTPLIVVQSPAGGTTILEETTVQVSVTDPSGNESICAFTISPLDNTPPLFAPCPTGPDLISVNSSCQFFMPDYSGLPVTDVCNPTLTLTQSPAAATPLTVTTSVTVTVSDGTNSTDCTFDVSPSDDTDPTIICPADQLESVDANCQLTLADYTGDATTDDNCDTSIDVTQSPTGTVSGNQTITLTATDDAGNTASCTFAVDVEDTTPPAISCPVSETVEYNASCLYTMEDLTGLATGISDNCPGSVVITQVPVLGTSIGGASTVELFATDDAGNVSSCTLQLIIEDNSAPVIVCPSDQVEDVDANCDFSIPDYTGLATVSDNCDAAPSVTQAPATAVNNGNGSSLLITLTAVDASGNSATCTFNQINQDVTDPVLTCPNPTPVTANANCEFVLTNFTTGNPGLDNCDASLTYSQVPAQSTIVSGNTLVTLYGEDDAGNVGSCSFTLVVEDGTNPTIVCPTAQSQLADADCEFVLDAYAFMATADDNCDGNVDVVQSPAAGTTQNADTQVTLTATDDAGNTANCTFDVLLTDLTAPSITCPSDTIVDFGVGCTFVMDDYVGDETALDNCDEAVSVTQSPAAATSHSSTTTVTLTASDDDGNQSSCTFDVIPEDNTAPTITCPSDQVVSSSIISGNCVFIIPDLTGSAIVADNCDPTPTVTQSPGVGNTITANTTMTLTVEDDNNNTADCTFDLILNDDADPSITCPGDFTVEVGASCTYAIVDYTALAVASDNCSTDPTVTQGASPALGSTIGPNVPTTITLTAEDDSSNTDVCTFVITAEDVTGPTVVCPGTTIVPSNSNCLVFLADYASGASSSDNCDGTGLTILQSPVAGTAIGGTTEVTLYAIDNSGNIGECVFDVELDDQTAPSIVCPSDQIVASDASCAYVLADYASFATVDDNCDLNPVVAQSPAALSNVSGVTAVTLMATDASGNNSNCTFDVTAEDILAPTITSCPENDTVSVTANCTHIMGDYTGDPTYTDNCDAPQNIIIAQAPLSGSLIGGNTSVTISATDAAGNSETCTFLVVPEDNDPPTIFDCPSDITQVNDLSLCGAIVTFGPITSIDNCAGVIVPQLDHGFASGSIFPVGTTEVEYIADDGNGNTTSCIFDVTVNDAENPIVICPPAQTVNVDPNTCGAVVTYADPTVTDNCPSPSTPALNAGLASGSTFPLGTTTNTYSSTDASGNTSSCSFDVTVIDNQAPTIDCPASFTQDSDPGNCDAIVTYTLPAVDDNCPPAIGPTLVSGGASGSVFVLGTTSVTYSVADATGNTNDCTFTVTVEDNEAPVLTCPADTSINCDATVAYDIPTVADNCNPAIVPIQIAPTGPFVFGPNVVTFSGDDGNGNTNTCSFTVTVIDTVSPTITCPGEQTAAFDASCELNAPDYTSLGTATDNCDASPAITQSPAAGSTITGTATITLIATDFDGNSTSCTFDVVDNTPPLVDCPQDQDVGVNANCEFVLIDYTLLSVSSDNCGSTSLSQVPAVGTLISGPTTVTIEAVDDFGNTSDCDFVLTPIDNVAPSITCIGNQTVFVNADCEFAVFDYTNQILAEDNCDASPVVTQVPAPGTLLSGSNQLSMTATDAAGNTISCAFTVTPEDNLPPTITCPGTQDVVFDANCEFSLQDYVGLAVTDDNCSAVSVSQSPAAGTLLGGNTVVTLTALDADLNASTCSFVVIPEDDIDPSIACPSDFEVDYDENCEFTLVDYTSLGTPSDNCSTTFTVSQSPSVGTAVSSATSISLSVADGNGNTASCSFTITPVDNTAPSITCIDDQLVVFDENCQFAVGDYNGSAVTGDNCSTAITVTQSPVAGTFVSGTETITLTADDGNGNTASCSFVVTPADETDPTIACPTDQDVSLGQDCGYMLLDYSGMATTDDNCSVTVAVTQDFPAGLITFDTVTVTLIAADGNGNFASCSFDVNPSDNTDPTVICPGDQDVDFDTNCEFVIPNYKNDVVRDDNCGSTTVTQTPDVGAVITGSTEIVIVVEDDNGNTATCSFFVNPSDNEAPTVACPVNQDVDLDANCQFELPEYGTSATAEDNCTSTLTIDQFPPVGTVILTSTVVTLSVEDDNGNPAECSFVVIPADNTDPVIAQCPDDQTAVLDENCELTMPDFTGLIQATDNCDIDIEYTQAPLAGSAVAGVGTYAITLGAIDDEGNFTLCDFDLIVSDDSDPMIDCPSDQILSLTANCEFVIPDYTSLAAASDACGSVTVTQSPLPGSVITSQLNASLIVEDEYGNSAACTFFVDLIELEIEVTGSDVSCNGGNDGTATASVVGGSAPYTYDWGGFDPNALAQGTYAVTAIDDNGCSIVGSVIINEGANFEIEISPNGNVVICEGESVVLDAGAGFAAYNWSTGASVQSINVSSQAQYWVTVTNAAGCISNTDTVSITFTDSQVPTIIVGGDGVLYCSNDTALTYQWYLNGDPINGESEYYYCPTVSGNYYVQITDSYGCVLNSFIEEHTYDANSQCATGIEEHGFILNVYPNPSTGEFVLNYSMAHEMDIQLSVYDMLGQRVIDQINILDLSGSQLIDLSLEADGIYSLRIAIGNDRVLQQRLILVK